MTPYLSILLNQLLKSKIIIIIYINNILNISPKFYQYINFKNSWHRCVHILFWSHIRHFIINHHSFAKFSKFIWHLCIWLIVRSYVLYIRILCNCLLLTSGIYAICLFIWGQPRLISSVSSYKTPGRQGRREEEEPRSWRRFAR